MKSCVFEKANSKEIHLQNRMAEEKDERTFQRFSNGSEIVNFLLGEVWGYFFSQSEVGTPVALPRSGAERTPRAKGNSAADKLGLLAYRHPPKHPSL